MPTKKKTQKAAPRKKTAATPAIVKSAKVQNNSRNILSKRNIIAVVILILIAVPSLLYIFRGMFIAATVNGQIITRMELNSELEKKSGKTTLENLITKDLILSEMKKKNVTVSDAEITSEMKKIESALSAQGRTLDDALAQQGLSKQDLADQVKIQKMIEKLFAKDIKVSDAEVNAYVEQNKDAIPEGQDEKTTKESAMTQLKQEKLTAKFQTWLADLQKKAKVQYYVNF